MIIFIAICIFIFALIFAGIYLLFHKCKAVCDPAARIDYINNLNISESAKEVHIKELKKQTQTRYTKEWFFEYWEGKRSAFYAWFTWLFAGNLIISALIGIVTVIVLHTFGEKFSWMIFVFALFYMIYVCMSCVILWRCANNSTTKFKYFARFFTILVLLNLVRSLAYC